MKISVWMATPPEPAGGLLATVSLANAMARRDHEVHLSLSAMREGQPLITGAADLPWLEPDPRLTLRFGDRGDAPLPPTADICIGLPVPGALPIVLLQGEPNDRQVPYVLGHEWPIIAVSRWVAELARRYGVAEHRVVHVPNGIDRRFFAPVEPLARRGRRVVMLMHSSPEKRSALGLEVLDEVRARVPAMTAALFGATEPRTPLPDWARFTLRPTREALAADIYGLSRVSFTPSVSEGFGLTALEAMARGCSVLTVDNGGSQEYADDGETAIVVAPDDTATMVDGISRLLTDDQLHHTLTAGGIERARTFDWDRSAARLEDFLERYLADPLRWVSREALDRLWA